MPLKEINGHLYYYRSVREGNRVRSVYCGKGGDALGAFGSTMLRAEGQQKERGRREAEERQADRLEGRIARYCHRTAAVWRAEMERRGYHQHARGVWRKRRMGNAIATKGTSPAPPAPVKAASWPDVRNIVDQAADGDKGALWSLKDLLRSEWRPKILATVSDPARFLNDTLVKRIAGGEAVEEILRARLEDLRRDVTPPDASPLERLLAGRVVTTWLACHVFEAEATNPGSVTPRVWELKQRLADRANRRFLASVKALAALRRTGPETLVQVINKGSVRVG